MPLHGSRVFVGIAVATLAVVLASGCTAHNPPDNKSLNTPTSAPRKQLRIPAVQFGELARLTVGLTSDKTSMGLVLPPSPFGYMIDWSCLSADPTDWAGWKLDYVPNARGDSGGWASPSTRCNGKSNAQQIPSDGTSVVWVNFKLIGQYNGNQMYAIIVPNTAAGY